MTASFDISVRLLFCDLKVTSLNIKTVSPLVGIKLHTSTLLILTW